MQYVGRAIGSVSKTWSSINPSTLSGAIDVIVVEQPDGTLSCSPFHVRFGKFQILKPSQKKVQVLVNDKSTNIPMKLSEQGEAHFVFETSDDLKNIPVDLLASPVLSDINSPTSSPDGKNLEEPSFLDIDSSPQQNPLKSPATIEDFKRNLNKKLTEIHIPSKLDNNGDILLDMEGYKPDEEMVEYTDEQLKNLLKEELAGSSFDISNIIKEDENGNIRIVQPDLGSASTLHDPMDLENSDLTTEYQSLYTVENQNKLEAEPTIEKGLLSPVSSDDLQAGNKTPDKRNINLAKNYIKTLRLTSDQLKCLNLKYGENDLTFSIEKGKAVVTAKMFVWRWNVPIVISDIDGTITKSDALGHLMNLVGKDWTHVGVANLFSEIEKNGYNIMYLTARSAGQADSTRNYLNSIVQDGVKLPAGPVILSPDRTMAALRREVILKKPEVFKIACLKDIRSLYFESISENIEYRSPEGEPNLKKLTTYEEDARSRASMESQSSITSSNTAIIRRCLKKNSPYYNSEDQLTPFFAGFGNRITDALSYRTVGIPSSRIFTINPEGEVHMELLELAGYKSSYVHINELVDHFFPPVVSLDSDFNFKDPNAFMPGSPVYNATIDYGEVSHMNLTNLNSPVSDSENTNDNDFSSPNNPRGNYSLFTTTGLETKPFFRNNQEEKYTDVNFWKEPILNLSDLSDLSDPEVGSPPSASELKLRNAQGKETIDKLPGTKDVGRSNSRSWAWGNKKSKDGAADTATSNNVANSNKDSGVEKEPHPIDSDDGIAILATSKEDIGKQIYLKLGSPLSSPKLTFIDNPSEYATPATPTVENPFDKINVGTGMINQGITKPVHAISGISKVNVFDNNHKPKSSPGPINDTNIHSTAIIDGDANEDFEDDEFDEDEFDEDDDEEYSD